MRTYVSAFSKGIVFRIIFYTDIHTVEFEKCVHIYFETRLKYNAYVHVVTLIQYFFPKCLLLYQWESSDGTAEVSSQ